MRRPAPRFPDGRLKTYAELVAEAGPCLLGGKHTEPGRNGMVYCEHGLSVWNCDRCCGFAPPDPTCDQCGKLKNDHTEAEAAYCITRSIAAATDRSIYVSGR